MSFGGKRKRHSERGGAHIPERLSANERNRYGVFLPAVAVTVLELILTGIDAGLRLVWETVWLGALECLTVYLMLVSWRAYRNSFAKGLYWGSAAAVCFSLLFFYFSFDEPEKLISVLFILSPAAVLWFFEFFKRKITPQTGAAALSFVVWLAILSAAMVVGSELTGDSLSESPMLVMAAIAESLVWAVLCGWKFPNGEKRETVLCRAWLICLTLFYFIVFKIHGTWGLTYFEGSCWYDAFILSLPVLCAAALRWLQTKRLSKLCVSAVYFGLGLFVVLHHRPYIHQPPVAEVYCVLIFVLVYVGEMRAQKINSALTHTFGAGFSLVSAVYLFCAHDRLREILYHLGGPALNITQMERVNWLAYRAAAAKSYFAGNVEAFGDLAGLQPFEHYQLYVQGSGIGALTFRYGWWWLLLLVSLVIAASVLLLKVKGQDAAWKRWKNYLAVSYLIRTGIVIAVSIFMVGSYDLALPFSAGSMLDLLILWMLLSRDGYGKKGLRS